MKDKHLHIVSFDIPYPANYGGVIDVYYKLKALSVLGVKIHLHCYEYSRSPSEVLQALCYKVYYYPRNTAKSQLFNKLPYIVVSRSNEQLLRQLTMDDYPILMEGLHSTFFINHEKLASRVLLVRTHNIEHHYYQSLARVENNIFKRYYFYNEAGKLEQYENVLQHATHILAISPNDTAYLDKHYGNTHYVAAFHPFDEIYYNDGKGDYALYHGNLAIGENNEAAMYLVQKVFATSSVPLVIAGSKPSMQLREAIRAASHIKLEADISSDALHQLIKSAQVNVLPTFQPTGIKLKLLSALYNGKHAVVNTPMIENTGLAQTCIITDDGVAMREAVETYMRVKFKKADYEKRSKTLRENFANAVNAEKIINLIW